MLTIPRTTLIRIGLRAWRVVCDVSVALSSPLLEKGAGLTRATDALDLPVVLSMKRLIVLIFAVVVARQVAQAGVTDWPLATLAITTICALPLLAALEKADPADVLALVRTMLAKVTQQAGSVLKALDAIRPSKYDDHRNDGPTPAAA